MEKQLLMKREKPGEFSTLKEDQLLSPLITKTSGGWEQKVWGQTRCLSQTAQIAVHELHLGTPGSFCSIHFHAERSNLFLVLAGAVRVVVRDLGRDASHLLAEGMSLLVPAGCIHQFQVVNSALLVETYIADCPENGLLSDDDIVRQHPGGLVGEPLSPGSLFLVSKKD